MLKTSRKWGGVLRFFITQVFLLLILSSVLQAETITLVSDQEINVEVYGKHTAKQSILWLGSERGMTGELQKAMLRIAKEHDIHVNLADLLDSYFIEPSRVALEKIPQQDLEDLIQHYAKQASARNQSFFLAATSRSASLVLKATHHLQTVGIKNFAGVILIAPYLQTGTPKVGESIVYQPITSHNNLPVYVMQAERSPRFIPLPHLIKALEKNNAPVFTHVYRNIAGGFHMRDNDDLSESDLQAKKRFPKDIANALFLLDQSEAAPFIPLQAYKKFTRKKKPIRLQSVRYKTPVLRLKDINGTIHSLNKHKGKAILVSFWASWCRPCIEEMPSLVKLKEKYADTLEILAVNVREDKATIKKFTGAMNINFPLLQDKDSKTTEDWKVYVYPSNYIVDKTGKLRYAATGAMDWQDKDIEALLENMWKQN